MRKQAIISKHIVLTSSPDILPVFGIILIENETIHEHKFILDPSTPTVSILDDYSEWNPEDLSDFYISPGLIDLNVRAEWESYSDLTKSAISGGVTLALVEQGYYMAPVPLSDLFCDIGKVARVDPSTYSHNPPARRAGLYRRKVLPIPACQHHRQYLRLPTLLYPGTRLHRPHLTNRSQPPRRANAALCLPLPPSRAK